MTATDSRGHAAFHGCARPESLAELVLQQARVGVREESGALPGIRTGVGGHVEPGEGPAVPDQPHRAVVLDLHPETAPRGLARYPARNARGQPNPPPNSPLSAPPPGCYRRLQLADTR